MLLWLFVSCSSAVKTVSDNVEDSASGSASISEPSASNEPSSPTSEPSSAPSPEPTAEPTEEPAAEPAEEPPPEPAQIVRFIAMGDGGEGNTAQYDNGLAIAELCENKTDEQAGCDFVLYLGDNFYDEGVSSVTDNQFNTKFEYPYEPLSIPFYVVLGNHDYGGCLFGQCGTGWDFELSQYQIDYSDISDKWTMPAEYYTFVQEHVEFFGLDTNAMMWDPWFDSAEDQKPWMEEAIANSTATWKIAFGHHPYISNGRHGNAGTYEGLDWLADWSIAEVPIGVGVKDFMDAYICGQMDLYLAGHDHNRQWLEPTCGTEFIVSGAAAKTTSLENRGNSTFFEDDQIEGFIWIEIRDLCMTGEFYDSSGSLEFEQGYCKE